MQAKALLGEDRFGEELRYVTQHFADLQGLRAGPVWASLLLLPLFFGPSASVRRVAFAAVTLGVSALAWFIWSGRWYEKRYGFVRNQSFTPDTASGLHWAGLAVLGLLVCILIFGDINHSSRYVPMLMGVNYILPKCFYSVSDSWPIRFRRVSYIAGAVTLLSLAAYAIRAPPFRST